jgi:hypothetical protein
MSALDGSEFDPAQQGAVFNRDAESRQAGIRDQFAGEVLRICMFNSDGTPRSDISLPIEQARDYLLGGARVGVRVESGQMASLPSGTIEGLEAGIGKATEIIEDHLALTEDLGAADERRRWHRRGALGGLALTAASEGVNHFLSRHGLLDATALASTFGGIFAAAKWWRYSDIIKNGSSRIQQSLETARKATRLPNPDRPRVPIRGMVSEDAPDQPTRRLPVTDLD